MRVFVAGHRGMVGAAIVRQLRLLGIDCLTRTRAELDLTDAAKVAALYRNEQPDAVIVAAAKVGGIAANMNAPAAFLYENLMIEATVIHQAHLAGIDRLLFLGSSCIYPRDAAQPIVETALLTGPLEPTNEPYAIAKIAGLKLCESYNRQYGRDYRSVMPTNLYGPGDMFHPENSHVLPGLMHRFHEARSGNAPDIAIWGSGTPRREFLHVDDLAAACALVLGMPRETYAALTGAGVNHINIGCGRDVSIAQLAQLIAVVTGYRGVIRYDPARPDGTPRKVLDVSRITSTGWRPKIGLSEGLTQTYDWFCSQRRSLRLA